MTGAGPPPAGLPVLDQSRFVRLMQMAGPEMGPELLARLDDDLSTVARGLHRALHGNGQPATIPPDWAELRAQTHVLIALAGTLGALRLHHMAEALNRQAHDRHPPDPAQVAALAALLDGLLHHIRACRAGLVPGARW